MTSSDAPPAREKPTTTCGGTRYPCCRWSREYRRLARKAFRKENRQFCNNANRHLPDFMD